MACSLGESVKREAEKFQQVMSVEAELESKRFITKLSALLGTVYEECERSSSKIFKENLKLLTAVISISHAVDEVWLRKEKERLYRTQSENGQNSVEETVKRGMNTASESSRSGMREKMSTSALSSRSSASCSRTHRHHSIHESPEVWSDGRGISFTKEKKEKAVAPDNPLGPGEYSPEYRVTATRSVAAFSTTSQRTRDFSNREISPGPAYNPRYNFLSK